MVPTASFLKKTSKKKSIEFDQNNSEEYLIPNILRAMSDIKSIASGKTLSSQMTTNSAIISPGTDSHNTISVSSYVDRQSIAGLTPKVNEIIVIMIMFIRSVYLISNFFSYCKDYLSPSSSDPYDPLPGRKKHNQSANDENNDEMEILRRMSNQEHRKMTSNEIETLKHRIMAMSYRLGKADLGGLFDRMDTDHRRV